MMNKRLRKILSCMLPVVLAGAMIIGGAGIVDVMGGPAIVAQVLGSDGDSEPTPDPEPAPVIPVKKSNPISVTGHTIDVSYATLLKKTVTVSRSKAMTVSGAKGTVTYKKTSGDKKISVAHSTGDVIVKKGLGAGKYKVSVTVKAAGNSDYKAGSDKVTFTVEVGKAGNTLAVKGKTVSLGAVKLSKGSVTFVRSKILTVSKARGNVTYKKTSGNSRIKINSKTGKLTVGKGLKAGTYKIRVKVTAAGNGNYKKASKTVTVRVNVTKAASKLAVKANAVERSLAAIAAGEQESVISIRDAVTITGSAGKLTYSKAGGEEGFTVDEKTGNIVIPAEIAAGTYECTVKVADAGNGIYKSASRKATVTITITE